MADFAKNKVRARIRRMSRLLCLAILISAAGAVTAHAAQAAQALPIPNIGIDVTAPDSPDEYVTSIRVLLLLAVLTMAPSFVLLATSFTRILVVFSFLRSAMGTQQVPPNQVIVALTLFLTLFMMMPVYTQVTETAVNPYVEGRITQAEAIEIGGAPIKDFMLAQTREQDLRLFYELSGEEVPQERIQTPFIVLIPAFTISELKTAFEIGFMIFLPFIVIDMVVASILMAMGMMMLPPVMVALPFKLLLFVMVDGWYLVVKSLMMSFL